MSPKVTVVLSLLGLLATVPQPAHTQAAIRLSLQQAVDLALSPEGDARLQLAGETVKQAQARAHELRAELFPTLEGTIGAQNLTRSLGAAGVIVPLPLPNFTFPDFVRPYTVFDFRSTLSQRILDLGVLGRRQVARSSVSVAEAERSSLRDQVAAQTARLYLAAWRARAALAAAEANVGLAEALLRQAGERLEAGKGLAIEVTRARVQLANDRQHLLAAQTGRSRAVRALLKSLRLKLDSSVELTTEPKANPADLPDLSQALAVARDARSDLRAQQSREDRARRSYSATRMERFPTLSGFADYGSIGTNVAHVLPTRTVGLALHIPLFDGGAREARRAESLSKVRVEEIRKKDLGEQVELEVRQALDNLRSAIEQVKISEEGLALAGSELEQAQRRYEAGLASGLELTDAQTRLVRARDNQVAAIYDYHQARIDFGEAAGEIRAIIQSIP